MFFFFNDTATTEIYTLSLHDALPICSDDPAVDAETILLLADLLEALGVQARLRLSSLGTPDTRAAYRSELDRKSTRLNSSHANISYAVFCLKKQNPPSCRPILPHCSL